MAEIQDQRLEALLRETLRREAETLPVAIRPDGVLRRARQRRLLQPRRNVRLLAVAAALLVPLSAILLMGSQGDRSTMLTPRSGHTATTLADGRVLVAGGYTDEHEAWTAEVYDPATGRVTATGSMTEARSQHTGTLLDDGRVLIVGGASADVYDPEAGTFSVVGQYHESRYGHAAALLPDGRVLIVGGKAALPDEFAEAPGVAIFDPETDQFEQRLNVDPLLDRMWPVAIPLDDGRILIAGGRDSSKWWRQPPAIVYDLATDSISLVANIPARRFDLDNFQRVVTAVGLTDGRALLLATSEFSDGTNAVIYDPGTDSNEIVAHLEGEVRALPGPGPVALADGRILILLGAPTPDLDAQQDVVEPYQPPPDLVYLFDPMTNEVTLADSMPSFDRPAVTALAVGGALVTGGMDPVDGATDRIVRIE